MSERWARTILATYRWSGAVAYPFVGGYVAWRATRGMEDRGRHRERYGRSAIDRPDGPVVWVHAVNDSETLAVCALIGRILALGINIVLTTGTVSSARIARERLGDRVIHQYVPLDLKPAVGRFLDHWAPDLAIIAESEIWPMTILELGDRRIPVVLVNGRMSDRAFAGWRRWPWLAEALMENLSIAITQSEKDAERFRALGARPVAVSGNLKTDIDPPPVDELELRRVMSQIGERPLWSALLTHPGEEAAAGEVQKLIMARFPGALTIIMPRDPSRGDAIESELSAMGLNVVRRSRRDKITGKSHVLLCDQPGESGLCLRLSDIAFFGGSLLGKGGENPIDAIALGAAVLSGQDIDYHREIYQPLMNKGGVRLVRDKEMLAGAVNYLLRNEEARRKIADGGAAALKGMRGALDLTVRSLEPFIHPLVVKARLDSGSKHRR
ncbi:MAG: 3-deoxy-D-manno-octulosonic acid transferase [Rhizobiaceae bacterium]|nr:3-deoxy-D-manno-octulosonic acid transferase [Rhizobiaceae bacterium]